MSPTSAMTTRATYSVTPSRAASAARSTRSGYGLELADTPIAADREPIAPRLPAQASDAIRLGSPAAHTAAPAQLLEAVRGSHRALAGLCPGSSY